MKEQKIAGGAEHAVMLDYPKLEIVAVDDRSSDGTSWILDEAANGGSAVKSGAHRKLPEGLAGQTAQRCSTV